MAAATNRFRALFSSSRATVSQSGSAPYLSYRGYATTDPSSATGGASTATTRKRTTFTDKLNAGPSFTDFVGGGSDNGPLDPSEAYALKTALVGPAGRKKEMTRLPSWLKTPIPDSKNYQRLKKDLGGLS